jgi:hypothetical protein
MPKPYKICVIKQFDDSEFAVKPFSLNNQLSINGVEPPPSTTIFVSRDQIKFEDFKSYEIEHEREEDILCRIGLKSYAKIIRKGLIKGSYSKKFNLLYLSGKKADILDFCKKTNEFNSVKISTIKIDMKELLKKLLSIKLVWFKFPKGLIHATALMGGAGIERTIEFKKYHDSGDISVLSFHFEFGEIIHPIMVTEDGAIVLQ